MSTTESRPDHDSFGALIRDVEATPEGRAELAQGQQWVYEQFYRDGPFTSLDEAERVLGPLLARCWRDAREDEDA